MSNMGDLPWRQLADLLGASPSAGAALRGRDRPGAYCSESPLLRYRWITFYGILFFFLRFLSFTLLAALGLFFFALLIVFGPPIALGLADTGGSSEGTFIPSDRISERRRSCPEARRRN
jgi:hypothetical protein